MSNPKLYRRLEKTKTNLRSNWENPFTLLQHMTERKNRLKKLFWFHSSNRIRHKHLTKSHEVSDFKSHCSHTLCIYDMTALNSWVCFIPFFRQVRNHIMESHSIALLYWFRIVENVVVRWDYFYLFPWTMLFLNQNRTFQLLKWSFIKVSLYHVTVIMWLMWPELSNRKR